MMFWSLEKLEKERMELIDVIDSLTIWERFSIDDRKAIALQITAHMMRLSELDAELAKLRSHRGDQIRCPHGIALANASLP